MPYSRHAHSPAQRQTATAGLRLRLGLLNLTAFTVAYGLARLPWERTQHPYHFVMPVDAQIPFVAWMAWPYMASFPLLVACFALAPAGAPLRKFSRRALGMTAVAGVCFALFPAENTSLAANTTPGFSAALLRFLDVFDGRGNQLPSLHVGYALLALTLTPYLKRWQRPVACMGLLMIAASAIFTHRHHVADAIAGVALAVAVILGVKSGRAEPDVVLGYFVMALFALTLSLYLGCVPLGVYLAISLGCIAYAYQNNNAHLAGKKNGRIPVRAWLLLAPWLLGYRITWWLQRLRAGGSAPFTAWQPDLYVGRRLTEREARVLPANCAVIDLSAELSETPALRTQHYHHVPLLDLRLPDERAMKTIAGLVDDERAAGRPVYLHCSMGLARSVQVAHFITSQDSHP